MSAQVTELSRGERRRLRHLLHQRLIDSIAAGGGALDSDDARLRSRIHGLIGAAEKEMGQVIAATSRTALGEELLHEVRGLGPLAALLADASVSDILINGPDEVWVDSGGQLHRTEVSFDDRAHLQLFLDRLLAAQGKQLDTTSPMVDAKLPDGSRLHAVIPPLCRQGPVVSIRRFNESPSTIQGLLEGGMLSMPMLDLLRLCVSAGINILITGGAAAGKSTLLNALSQFIPTDERIITIEEAAELQLRHPHVVTLEARQGNSDGRGRVDLRTLLRNALRMRADRIIVGEVRGDEVFDMLQAMTVGHDGSLSTLHANSAGDALKRLESLAMLADVGLPRAALRDMIASAIQLVVQVARLRDGSRCITHISAVVGEPGHLRVQDIFRFEPDCAETPERTAGRPLNRCGRHRSCGYTPDFVRNLRHRGYVLPASLGVSHHG